MLLCLFINKICNCDEKYEQHLHKLKKPQKIPFINLGIGNWFLKDETVYLISQGINGNKGRL